MAGEKRSQDREETLHEETVILVDIEGTTTSIGFVKNTLFPYVRENVKKYVETKWEDEEFKKDLEKLKEQAAKDAEDKVEGIVAIAGATPEEEKESVVKNVLWQMDGDRKNGALKQLQGHMWREAYKSGAIKGHIYDDVPKALESWTAAGRKVYVYSSGSVEAQKLLFGNSEHGDLLKYFSGNFDTEMGMKQEAASYKNILTKIEAEASKVIFLTDIVKEAQAAKEAGMSTVILLREGNAPLTDEEKAAFTTIKSFLDLSFQSSAKRPKLDIPEQEEKKDEKKVDEPKKSEVADEPMETTDDVEMTDVSDKEPEKAKEVKEVVEPEQDEKKEAKSEDKVVKSDTNKEEAMEADAKTEMNGGPAETETAVKAVKASDEPEKAAEVAEKKAEKVEKPQESTAKPATDETDKAVVAETAEVCKKPIEAKKETEKAISESSASVSEPMEEAKVEPKSESEKTEETTETKTEDIEKTAESAKAETKMETETKAAESAPLEESAKKEETPAKVEETAAKAEETSVKAEEAAVKVDEKPAKEEVKENGTTEKVEPEKAEKPSTVKMDTEETSEVSDKSEATPETKKTEPEVEKKAEEVKEPDVIEKEETKAEGVIAETDASKEEVDKSKQDAGKEGAKEEETKAETTAKKVNGTTQNGDSVAPAADDKPHTNGLNDESTSGKTDGKTKKSSADASTESINSMMSTDASTESINSMMSTDASSTESIKVKKVVDTTVADGAGEPDVVPPVAVAVAATS